MPTFRVTDPNHSVYRWDGLGNYDVTTDTARKIVLTFSSAKAGRSFESDSEPWKVVMNIKGGEVVRTSYRDNSGDELARITGTDTDPQIVRMLLDPNVDKGWEIYQLLLQDGATFQANANSTWPTGNNDLTTSIGDDVVRSNGGDMYVKDRGGADTYIGGANYDSITYDEWFWRDPARVTQGIDADLKAGKITGPDGEVDTVRGPVEEVRGTFLRDVLRGDGLDNQFHGYRGNDLIDGRGGNDQVTYRQEENQGGGRGVTVNLKKGFAKDSFGDRDQLVSIERAEGTDFRDRFIDGGGDNQYRGRAGNDVFIFRGGDDEAEGGDGGDRFVYKGTNFGDNNEIWDFDPTEGDRLKITAANDLGDLTIDQNGSDLDIRLNGNSRVTLEDFILGSTDPASFIL